MAMKVNKVEVWAGELQDQPGALANVLSAVANAGGNLECVVARREASKPGMGVVFVTPVRGAKVQDAARGAGLSPAQGITTLRVDGADRPGLGAAITEALAATRINLRGVTTAVVGRNFVCYVGLDSGSDADAAMAALRQVKTPGRGGGGSRRSTTTARGASKRGGGGGSAKRAGRAGSRKSTARSRR